MEITSPRRILSQGLTGIIASASVEQEDPPQGTYPVPLVEGAGQRRGPPRGPMLHSKFEKAPEKDILGHYSFRQKVTEPSF